MIVTTAEKPEGALVEKAKRLAEELDAPYIPRRRDTLRGLERKHGSDGVLVVAPDGLKYVSVDRPPLFFHPSMGLIRVKRLIRGEPDAMIGISGALPGDSILDCTAGLASDAIVFSHAVGAGGQVTAIEASPLLYAVVREGLQTARTGLPEADEACRRIAVRLGDHAEVLRSLADRSVDIVYFDPMFERPVQASASLLPLRSHARHDPLSEETVREAVRVARKSVLLKNAGGSAEFSRLGFVQARVSASAVSYGVIRI
ncbi:SAM-dependent methyltransferase [Cohnella sp. CFH 77786]|uniref:class I SAM-dependent methyltransferase n=1 Tax=Cohnella sp. CFH 77786 TaxID=2662265 RepID=UPI001C60A1A5|nr:class I SAM-dependent methyltransferase [Cohnella sp. CFH 77786]MBW5448197.1 SAM-dependent methyltransferase [Cohnella sp. CFH 77786]